jgi:hypothetical protein
MPSAARPSRSLRAGASIVLFALVAACGPVEDSGTNPTDVHAEVSEFVSTVVNVHWKSALPSKGYVEYGPTDALGLNTPIGEEETKSHTQALIGLKPDTVYYYRVVSWDGADAGRSELKSARTGYLPPGMPTLRLTGTGHDEFIITTLLGQSKGILILDPEGNIVWFHDDVDSELQYYRARLARDGKSILYNSADISGEPAADSSIVRISFDGSVRTATPIPLLAHDFVEHADGTLGAIVIEDRDGVRGNKIVEVDPDGNLTDVWTTWDCFDPDEDPSNDPRIGWTFTNALDYDSNLDVYYVSIRNFSSVARIDRKTGTCDWVLGSVASTLEFAQGSAQFDHEHQFHIFGNHLLIMDNEGSLKDQESRVLEYELDFETNVATEVWRYLSTPPVYTYVLGEPTRYPNGDTFINWSTAGQMERVTADGETTWKLNSSAGGVFGFNTLAKNLYAP